MAQDGACSKSLFKEETDRGELLAMRDARDTLFVQLYDQEYTHKAIGERFGCSGSAMGNTLKRERNHR